MTESEALEKLKANLECQKKQVYGRYEDCNSDKCDDCELCYKQGNNGERIESTKIAIQALEKQIPKKLEIRNATCDDIESELRDFITAQGKICRCPTCKDTICVSEIEYCWYCGQRLDWSDENDD